MKLIVKIFYLRIFVSTEFIALLVVYSVHCMHSVGSNFLNNRDNISHNHGRKFTVSKELCIPVMFLPEMPRFSSSQEKCLMFRCVRFVRVLGLNA